MTDAIGDSAPMAHTKHTNSNHCQESARRSMMRTVQRWFSHSRNGQLDLAREQLDLLIAEATACRNNPPPRFPHSTDR